MNDSVQTVISDLNAQLVPLVLAKMNAHLTKEELEIIEHERAFIVSVINAYAGLKKITAEHTRLLNVQLVKVHMAVVEGQRNLTFYQEGTFNYLLTQNALSALGREDQIITRLLNLVP
jgi:hypothetical protein